MRARSVVVVAQLEGGHGLRQSASLVFQAFCCGRAFFHQGCVLLGRLVQLGDGGADLIVDRLGEKNTSGGRDLFQARRDDLPTLLPLLPDAEAPTVMQVDGADRMALQALCHGAVTWQRLEDLKRAGASGLMVVPVEGMLA